MKAPKIGVVGPCAAGKSTLVAGLTSYGYWGKQIAQEHSYVADMWRRISQPDVLIYLNVSYPQTIKRKNLNWTEAEYAEQIHRLRHARQHADLKIDTTGLTAPQVLQAAIAFLNQRDIYPKDTRLFS